MNKRAEQFSQAARRYSELGWALIRVNGKDAFEKRWQQTLPDRDLEHVAGVWKVWGERWNMGAVLGTSGIAVVEFDSEAAGDKLVELLDGELPTTPIVQSRRGVHLYFRAPIGADKVARDGLELRAGAHMCVLPPSVHPDTGAPYRWMRWLEPWSVALADIPAAIVDYFETAGNGKRAAPIGDTIPEGERNETLASLAGTMRRRGASEAVILAALRVMNEQCKPAPLPDDEIERIAASIASYPPATASRRVLRLGQAGQRRTP